MRLCRQSALSSKVQAEEKQYIEGHMSLTKEGNLPSRSRSTDASEQWGEGSPDLQKPAILLQREWWIDTPLTHYGKGNAQTLSRTVNLFSPFAIQ